MKLLLAIVFWVFFLSGAQAQWMSDIGEDPLTDEPFAYMGAPDRQMAFTLFLKCWRDTPENGMLAVMTPLPYDESADYKSTFDVQFRIDKKPVRTLVFEPRNLNGKIGFVWSSAGVGAFVDMVSDLSSAQRQVALSLLNTTHVFSARGSTKAAGRLMRTCALDRAVASERKVTVNEKRWFEMQRTDFMASLNRRVGKTGVDLSVRIKDCSEGEVRNACALDLHDEGVAGSLFYGKEDGRVDGIMAVIGGGDNQSVARLLAFWKGLVDVVEYRSSEQGRKALVKEFIKGFTSDGDFSKTTASAKYSLMKSDGLGVFFSIEKIKQVDTKKALEALTF